MLISSETEMRQLGLYPLLETCLCQSPQGLAEKRRMRFFRPDEKNELEREFEILGRLRTFLKDESATVSEAIGLLARFRNVSGTLKRLEREQTLDETEFFEVKRCLSLIARLASLKGLAETADVTLTPLPEAEALLNPGGENPLGFYVYSLYSEKLAEIRSEKKRLERLITQSEGEERAKLLAERAVQVTEEKAETREQLIRLSRELASFQEQLVRNLEQVGRLDFLLARARLADSWNASLPVLLEEGAGSELEGVIHPEVEGRLSGVGRAYTPQSIRILPGATVISGANMGGKSVALQSFLLTLLLTQLGYCPPCTSVKTELYRFFAFTSDHPGEASLGLSSFGMEAAEIREHLRLATCLRGLVVMDEPCRGTNPREATAITTALCRLYVKSPSSLLIATHYRIPQSEGIRYYQIRGIREEQLCVVDEPADPVCKASSPEELLNSVKDALRPAYNQTDQGNIMKEEKDLEAVRTIREQMDYRLTEVDGTAPIPAGAIRIAEWMGIDEEAVAAMRKAYEEERWQH